MVTRRQVAARESAWWAFGGGKSMAAVCDQALTTAPSWILTGVEEGACRRAGLRPTFFDGVVGFGLGGILRIRGRPVSFSARNFLAKEPSWISLRMDFMLALISGVTMRDWARKPAPLGGVGDAVIHVFDAAAVEKVGRSV